MRHFGSGSRKGVYVNGYFRNGSWVEGYYRGGVALGAHVASDTTLADASFPKLSNNNAPAYTGHSKNQSQQTSAGVSPKRDLFIIIAFVVILVLCIISWIVT